MHVPGEDNPFSGSEVFSDKLAVANLRSIDGLVADGGHGMIMLNLSDDNSHENNGGVFVPITPASSRYKLAMISATKFTEGPREYFTLHSQPEEHDLLSRRLHYSEDTNSSTPIYLYCAEVTMPATLQRYHALIALPGNRDQPNLALLNTEEQTEAVERFGISPNVASEMRLVQLNLRRMFPEFYEHDKSSEQADAFLKTFGPLEIEERKGLRKIFRSFLAKLGKTAVRKNAK